MVNNQPLQLYANPILMLIPEAEKRQLVQTSLETQVIPAIQAFEMRLQTTKMKVSSLEEKLDDMTKERAELQAKYVMSLPPGEDPEFEGIPFDFTCVDKLVIISKTCTW